PADPDDIPQCDPARSPPRRTRGDTDAAEALPGPEGAGATLGDIPPHAGALALHGPGSRVSEAGRSRPLPPHRCRGIRTEPASACRCDRRCPRVGRSGAASMLMVPSTDIGRRVPMPRLSDIELCAWIAQAEPGDFLEYHRGFLGIDVTPVISLLPEPERHRLAAA